MTDREREIERGMDGGVSSYCTLMSQQTLSLAGQGTNSTSVYKDIFRRDIGSCEETSIEK